MKWQEQWAGLLGLIAAVVLTIVVVVHNLAKPYIAAAEARWRAALIDKVLPYPKRRLLPNDTVVSERTKITPYALPANDTAWVLETWTPQGYGGDIVLLLGVSPERSVTAVQVLSHRETPGIGDQFQYRDWLHQFDHHLATQALPFASIDQLSGATITSKAIVQQFNTALSVWRNHVD